MLRAPSDTDLDAPAPAPARRGERRTSDEDARRLDRPDRVDAWGADSFPASDPPSWWSGA